MTLRFVFAILIFLFLFPALLKARDVNDIAEDNFQEAGGRGLAIRTNPPGADVFIDGVRRGVTPLVLDNLEAGEHHIRLTKEGYKERRFNVTLRSNSRLEVSIVMEEERGLVLVTVYRARESNELVPFNPQITAGALGETQGPVFLSSGEKTVLSLPVGLRTIRARAFGWEDASVTVLVRENFTASADIYMEPAVFRLERGSQNRRRFNPANSGNLGVSEFRFEVSAPGEGIFTVRDKNGTTVYEKRLDRFDTWFQSVTWNGRDSGNNPLGEGFYTAVIEAHPLPEYSTGSAQTEVISFESEINYSLNIFPVSLSGGTPGLVFAPLPQTLPSGSFQIEGGFLFGSFRENEARAFSGLPFEIGFRFSPLNRLEISAVFNANPLFDNMANSAGWGISGSVKYNFIETSPVSLSAAVSYAWANENGEAPLSPGKGLSFYTPFSLELENFLLVFSPGVFWHGPESPTPALLLPAGIFYRGGWISSGLSLRPEIYFTDSKERTRFLAGLEVRLFPPPSNLVFSLQAGIWNQGGQTGGYGGLGIGIIY